MNVQGNYQRIYEKNIQDSYFMIQLSGEWLRYQYEMLRHQPLPMLLKLHIREENEGCRFCYDITGQVSLGDFVRRHQVEEHLLIGLFNEMLAFYRECGQHLLDEGGLLLNLLDIYIEPESGHCAFVYGPAACLQENPMLQMRELLKALSPYIQKHDAKAVSLFHQLSMLVEEEYFCLEMLTLVLHGERIKGEIIGEESPIQPVLKQGVPKDKRKSPTFLSQLFGDKHRRETPPKPSKWGVQLAVEKPAQIKPYLVDSMGTRIPILMESFLIGKLKNSVDLYLQNDTISRIHCKVYAQEGQYFIMDLESRNGTYLNGERLVAHQAYPLPDGAEVLLSTESFRFRRR